MEIITLYRHEPPKLRNTRAAVGAALQFVLKLGKAGARSDGGADGGLGDSKAGADGAVGGRDTSGGRGAEEVFEGGEEFGIGIDAGGEVEAEEDFGAFYERDGGVFEAREEGRRGAVKIG